MPEEVASTAELIKLQAENIAADIKGRAMLIVSRAEESGIAKEAIFQGLERAANYMFERRLEWEKYQEMKVEDEHV